MTQAYPIATRRNGPQRRHLQRTASRKAGIRALVPRILEPLLKGARLNRGPAQVFLDRGESFFDSSDSDPKALHVIAVGQRGVLFVFFGDNFGFSD
jgi:hypothetical protein